MNKKDVFHRPPVGSYCSCFECKQDRKNSGHYHSKWIRREGRFMVDQGVEEYYDEKVPVWVYVTEEKDLMLEKAEEMIKQIFGEYE